MSGQSPRRRVVLPPPVPQNGVNLASLLLLTGVDAVTGLLGVLGAPLGGWQAGVLLLVNAAWLAYFTGWG